MVKKKRKSKKKKNYNPFKMWGSYVGFILFWVLATFMFISFPYTRQEWFDYAIQFWAILVGIFGFLIGWGIHSLFRKIRR